MLINSTFTIIQRLIICTSILLNLTVRSAQPDGSIQLRDGTPFRIALFADLHFGENSWTDWGPRQDVKSCAVMSNILDKEQPDFVVYLGDVITANNVMTKNATLYWDQAVLPTRTRGIPWSSIFGNHDDAPFEWPLEWFSETGIPQLHCPGNSLCTGGDGCSFRGTTRLELLKSETSENSLSYSKIGPESLWPGISNYVIKLLSSSESKEVIALLYFFDSGGGSYPKFISDAQVKWFQLKSKEVNPDSRVPEIIFWHIPSEAFKVVAPNQDRLNRCIGSMFSEDVAHQEAEMGIMKVLEERTSVKGVFVGHNHGLDWCCPYKKLWLCFARHTGYGGYGNWTRGARILEINQKPFTLKSWIRMEDDHVHSEVVLSS